MSYTTVQRLRFKVDQYLYNNYPEVYSRFCKVDDRNLTRICLEVLQKTSQEPQIVLITDGEEKKEMDFKPQTGEWEQIWTQIVTPNRITQMIRTQEDQDYLHQWTETFLNEISLPEEITKLRCQVDQFLTDHNYRVFSAISSQFTTLEIIQEVVKGYKEEVDAKTIDLTNSTMFYSSVEKMMSKYPEKVQKFMPVSIPFVGTLIKLSWFISDEGDKQILFDWVIQFRDLLEAHEWIPK